MAKASKKKIQPRKRDLRKKKPTVKKEIKNNCPRKKARTVKKQNKKKCPRRKKRISLNDEETEFLIPRKNFSRLIRQVMKQEGFKLKFQPQAMEALQYAGERFLTNHLSTAFMVCCHASRKTLQQKDVLLVSQLKENFKNML